MKEYISVKDYAAKYGLTEQAVYKNIRSGKLVTEERVIDGKRKKMIVLDLDQIENQEPDQNSSNGSTPPPKVETAGNDEKQALEKAVEALTQQLAEKDRQIANLMQLLHDQQLLQAHSQSLLTQPEAEETLVPEEIKPEERKRSRWDLFWDWWFK